MTITHEYIKGILGRRERNSHKGSNGRGLLIAGGPGMYGAAVMSACSALRSGIGTLKVFCPSGAARALMQLPEAMAVTNGSEGWEDYDRELLCELISQCSCLGLGPGMGGGDGPERALRQALESKKCAVIDADGLNALSRSGEFELLHDGVVITPHMGEMSRLTGIPVKDIKDQPAYWAGKQAREWGCTVLLKGADTHIAAPDGRAAVNTNGNPGLAKGGSGDLLTGIVLAMLGQGLKPFEAACAGAYLLGASADRAVDILMERMLMARDVAEALELTLKEGFYHD